MQILHRCCVIAMGDPSGVENTVLAAARNKDSWLNVSRNHQNIDWHANRSSVRGAARWGRQPRRLAFRRGGLGAYRAKTSNERFAGRKPSDGWGRVSARVPLARP